KRGVMKPTLFLDVLGIAAAFERADGIVIFDEVKIGDLPTLGVEIAAPPKDWFWKGMDRQRRFGKDEGDEESVFIDHYCSSAAESLDYGNSILRHLHQIKQLLRFARNTHHDGAG